MTNEEAAVWTALIVAVPTIITAAVVPIVLRLLDMKTTREKEEREDRNRMFLAQATEQVAQELKTNTALTVRAATVARVDRRELAIKAEEKLDTIHDLVNSNMTLAIQAESDAVARELVALNRLKEVHLTMDETETAHLVGDITRAEVRLEQLRIVLAERHAKDK